MATEEQLAAEKLAADKLAAEKLELEKKKKTSKLIDEQPLIELQREIDRLTSLGKEKDTELAKTKEEKSVMEAALKAMDIKKNSKTDLSLLEIVHRILHPYYYDNPFDFITGKKKD